MEEEASRAEEEEKMEARAGGVQETVRERARKERTEEANGRRGEKKEEKPRAKERQRRTARRAMLEACEKGEFRGDRFDEDRAWQLHDTGIRWSEG